MCELDFLSLWSKFDYCVCSGTPSHVILGYQFLILIVSLIVFGTFCGFLNVKNVALPLYYLFLTKGMAQLAALALTSWSPLHLKDLH